MCPSRFLQRYGAPASSAYPSSDDIWVQISVERSVQRGGVYGETSTPARSTQDLETTRRVDDTAKVGEVNIM